MAVGVDVCAYFIADGVVAEVIVVAEGVDDVGVAEDNAAAVVACYDVGLDEIASEGQTGRESQVLEQPLVGDGSPHYSS